MNISVKYKLAVTAILCCSLISCEDFLEIEAPGHKMISEVVFEKDETAISAMKGIYNQLFGAAFSGGGFDSTTVLAGLSADVLTTIRSTSYPYVEFDQLEILPDNFRNQNLWSSAYNIIYLTNSLLEGIDKSNNISDDVYTQLKGEASFVRAFTYFYLVNLYGDVPLILSTNYQDNAIAVRNSKEEIYEQILADLQTSEALLKEFYLSEERTEINRFTVAAMLARVQLYLGNWEEAERLSSEVIAQNGTYEILDNLNEVFLANSKEAIWQLSPEGRGSVSTHTNEGSVLIIDPILSFAAQIKLEPTFVDDFESTDKRLLYWVDFDNNLGDHFAHKYKIRSSRDLPIEEYSMVLRLAEQYLIRAEARTRLDNIIGAVADIDVIRERAGLNLISELNPQPGKEQVLEMILEERKVELFAEWGHRWLDLKRTGVVRDFLSDYTPNFQESDLMYPIPEAELMKNPNLQQNPGY